MPPTVTAAKEGGLDLNRLKELDNPRLTPVQKANLGLQLYRAEMLHPTPRPRPPATDPQGHDYVLAQITRKLADGGADVSMLHQLWQRANPGEVKDSLAIFLALKGQAEAREAVSQYVRERRHPLPLRELAARGLGVLGAKTRDARIGDVLAQVLREDAQGQYQVLRGGGGSGTAMRLVYPVRRAAVAGIRQLEQAGVLLPSYVTQAAERAQVEVPLPARGAGKEGKPPAAPGK